MIGTKEKTRSFRYFYFIREGGRESCKYVSLKTKLVDFSSDAFRCSGTCGESGDEHEHLQAWMMMMMMVRQHF